MRSGSQSAIGRPETSPKRAERARGVSFFARPLRSNKFGRWRRREFLRARVSRFGPGTRRFKSSGSQAGRRTDVVMSLSDCGRPHSCAGCCDTLLGNTLRASHACRSSIPRPVCRAVRPGCRARRNAICLMAKYREAGRDHLAHARRPAQCWPVRAITGSRVGPRCCPAWRSSTDKSDVPPRRVASCLRRSGRAARSRA